MLCCYADELQEDFYPWIDKKLDANTRRTKTHIITTIFDRLILCLQLVVLVFVLEAD
ncbi:hypothetical protein FCM35_KLT18708 [Carex littledalei]|uniref:Uncharacterized protein n=1 Tax=Carex littledalei TaxID=544730 RepID=A0A833RLP8_9POAL|nr:hypothetical protein FCM35_KLT18708 [Carex littledalei]